MNVGLKFISLATSLDFLVLGCEELCFLFSEKIPSNCQLFRPVKVNVMNIEYHTVFNKT